MKQVTIQCTDISQSFSNGGQAVEVLKHVSLTAHEEEMIMLMGPSGSGKTTLISIIGGILTPTSGECMVLGKSINDLVEPEKSLFRGTNIGFMFQKFTLVPTLTAVENTALPLLCLSKDHDAAFERARVLLTELGLEQKLESKPSQLSGGEQQRIAIARACIHQPRILLCDEPTGFLDAQRGKQILEILQRIKHSLKSTIIVVTHDHRILPYADAILEIDDGMVKHKDMNFEQSAL